MRPPITLEEIPQCQIVDPQVLWDCEKCFKTAVKDKLGAYIILSPQGDTNKADLLLLELAPYMNEPSVKKLPVQRVVDEMKAAAEQLELWKARAHAWTIGKDGLELKGEKEQLETDFDAFDKCLGRLSTYEDTLEQLKRDSKKTEDDADSRKKTLENKCYLSLRNQGLPAGIGKVEFKCILSSSFST